jgi:ubiquinone/menaquinone biosynthesis C-methylase UbiE
MKIRRTSFFVFIVLICIHFSANAQYSADDWNWRDAWMPVEKLFVLADVRPGNSVADLGCHEGYLTMHLAQKVGKQGKVYAVDVRNDRLQTLITNAKERKLNNITAILGDYDNPKLPSNSLDVIFVIDTYHEISAYKEVLEHLKISLKSGAKLVFLEKLKKRLIGKPRKDQVAGHTLALSYVKNELRDAGFRIRIEIDDFGQWEEDPTKIMWVLIAEKL